MLTAQQCNQIGAFSDLLHRVDMPEQPFDKTALQLGVTELQQFFRQHLWCLGNEDLIGPTQQVQAVLVELDKQLRLLEMDAVFLQAARQPATLAQRSQQIRDRLTLLIRYCDMLRQLA